MSTELGKFWRKCTTCKNPIEFDARYWICSVSSCNRKRTDLVFCNLQCFDAHVPVLNHRDAGAYERIAPSYQKTLNVTVSPLPVSGLGISSQTSEAELLVIVSKVKAYIRSKSGMNTSESVMKVLSQNIRQIADTAIHIAEKLGRKTVMDRDIDQRL